MPTGQEAGHRGRRAIPGVVFAALTVATVTAVVLLGLTVRQPPPPTTPELAPQAVERVEEAPSEQSSEFGRDRGRGGAVTTPAPAPGGGGRTTVQVPRVRRCIGDRQTEDPQSPPCVPYWEGDNGGRTAKGVTANEIWVALPDAGGEDPRAIDDLFKHFNLRYQFYGRQLVKKPFGVSGGFYAQPDPAAMVRDAVKVDEVLGGSVGIFASLNYAARYGAEYHYYDELARRGIISVSHRAQMQDTEERYRRNAPYQWGVRPGVDLMLRQFAAFVCAVLARRPPVYGGPEFVGARERAFGLVYDRTQDGSAPDVTPLREGLRRCGVELRAEQENRPSADPARTAQNVMIALRAAGVTSLVCWCDLAEVRGVLMPAATAQGYQPEWLLSTYIDNDVDNGLRTAPPDQAARVIGLTFRNKWLPRADMPWYQAIKEVDPTYEVPEGAYYHLSARYASLLLLASGIQMAGPKLTPATFERALHTTRFPNPGAGGPPAFQARVGFEGGRYTMIRDAAMWWYDHTQPSTAEPSQLGAVCYVDRGVRYGEGEWQPQEPRFRQGPCA